MSNEDNSCIRVICITEVPYWKQDHHRYGVKYLMQKKYEVEIRHALTLRLSSFAMPYIPHTGDIVQRDQVYTIWRIFKI